MAWRTTSRWMGCGLVAAVAACQALAGSSNAPAQLQPVHHGGGREPAVAALVSHYIEIADEACLIRGSDEQTLSSWAQSQHWLPVAPADLKPGQNEFTTLVAGWTFETPFSAFAVVQSRLNEPHDGYVCSVTTKLASASQHIEIKTAIQSRFEAVIERETERAESHTDHFRIEHESKPVKVTLVYVPQAGSITIRMLHSTARHGRSALAPDRSLSTVGVQGSQ
jgi:hypothetical protein